MKTMGWQVAAAWIAAAGCAGATAGTSPAAPAPEGRLAVVASGTRAAGEALVNGAEKPNGFVYRYRQSVPAGTPGFLPRTLGALQLWIADSSAAGWLAFYRTPPEPDWRNSAYRALLYDHEGAVRWQVDLGALLSRPTQLEIQDVRLGDDGDLYLNEACQTYARDAARECSALLRVDPATGRVRWRTPPLTSNNVLLLHGPHVIAGYGFTAEPDSLFLVARSDGQILDRIGLDTAHQYLELVGGDVIVLTNGRHYRVRVR